MKLSSFIILLFTTHIVIAQTTPVRTLDDLINKVDPAWPLVQEWMKEAKNHIEVLPKDSLRADSTLTQLQVTTRSPMGAITYETGGILVNHGWIRILGSGSAKLPRTITNWNFGKSFTEWGQQPSFLLIADDIIGGFYAINNGGISEEGIGKIFYFAPDRTVWEPMDMTYTQFLLFCFSGKVDQYYQNFYWTNWQTEIAKLNGDKGIHCMPPLFTKEGENLNLVSRSQVPIQELWDLYFHKK